jgi:hypothetical protein
MTVVDVQVAVMFVLDPAELTSGSGVVEHAFLLR